MDDDDEQKRRGEEQDEMVPFSFYHQTSFVLLPSFSSVQYLEVVYICSLILKCVYAYTVGVS